MTRISGQGAPQGGSNEDSVMQDVTNSRSREQYNREFFDGWAHKYNDFRISRWFQYTQQLALEQFEWRPEGRLLDVGCGTGYAVHQAALRLREGKACGVDISPAMVARAKANIPPQLAGRIHLEQAGAENLPCGDNEFDYVLCTNSFHHYHKPLQALHEMRRVLKPGGSLVIFENAPDLSLYTWAWDRFLRIFERGHVKYYPSAELGTMIRDSGFEDIELRVLKNEMLKHGKLFASIQIWAARAPTCPNTSKKI